MKAYKPRWVEFIRPNGQKISVDTRKGKNGAYPGDEYRERKPSCYARALVLGVNRYSWIVFAFKTGNDEDIHIDFVNFLPGKEILVKRHAQHLIDSGEMIQEGEQ